MGLFNKDVMRIRNDDENNKNHNQNQISGANLFKKKKVKKLKTVLSIWLIYFLVSL